MRCLHRTRFLFILSITLAPPLLFFTLIPNCWGLSQYEYRVPYQENDGWETASLTSEAVDQKRIVNLLNKINAEIYPNIHSVLLIKNGKIILEEYFSNYDCSKIHTIQSCTKSITSILVGIAIDRNIISDVNDKIYKYLSMYKGTEWIDRKYDITIRHALIMAGGLDWDERTYPYTDLRNDNKAMKNSSEWIEYILNKNNIETQGERFNYTSGLSILLGEIIKQSSGLFADAFADKYLFKPLGISFYHWYRNSLHGTIHTGGGLYLRPRDMAKIGYMMLNGGKWKDKQIISKSWIKESTQKHISSNGFNYGYQWWRGKAIRKNRIVEAFWAAGAGGQFIFVLPELDLVVVFTAKRRNNPEASNRAFRMLDDYILPAVLENYPDQRTIKVSNEILDNYTGEYKYIEGQETVIVKVFRKGDKLYVKSDSDKETAELFPQTNTRFFGTSKEIGDLFINFIEDDKSIANQFILNFSRGFAFITIPFDKIK